MKLARCFSIAAAIALLALSGSRVATAQPVDPDVPDESDTGDVDTGDVDTGDVDTGDTTGYDDTEEPPAPVAEPTPAPAPAPAPPPAAPVTPAEPPSDRPVGLSLGIGVGYLMPTAVDTPNVASARVRLAGGLIIEPRVQLEYDSQTHDDGLGDPDTSKSTNGVTTLGLAGLLLYPMYSRGPFDFLLNGGVGVSRTVENPDGDDNDTTYTNFYLSWGLGINYWLSRHWSATFLVQNPLVSYGSTVHQSIDFNGDPIDVKDSTLGIGATFDPSVSIMIHLYY